MSSRQARFLTLFPPWINSRTDPSGFAGTLSGEVRCEDPFVQMYPPTAASTRCRWGGSTPRCRGCEGGHSPRRERPLSPRPRCRHWATGKSLGPGLVLDFSQAMADCERGGRHGHRSAGCGARSTQSVSVCLRAAVGPDPATGGVTTMGSVLALDNSGSNWLRYGSARRHGEHAGGSSPTAKSSRRPAIPSPITRTSTPTPAAAKSSAAWPISFSGRRRHQANQPRSWVNRAGYHPHRRSQGRSARPRPPRWSAAKGRWPSSRRPPFAPSPFPKAAAWS
jgi:hypothetical protein